MAQAENYSQTILLDANRLSSEEFSASNLAQTNPSVFTNKVSSGITLDIGDTVSIESAHIAQRGAGGDTIEMRGRVLGKKNIVRTEFTNSSFVGFGIARPQTTDPLVYCPTGFAQVQASNITEEVDMKDNEASIVVEFYKTSNGENCFSLPRNFGNASANNASLEPYTTNIGKELATNAAYWEVKDGYPLGCQTFTQTRMNYFISGTGGDKELCNVISASGADVVTQKVRMNNERFTIFKRQNAVYNASEVSEETLGDVLIPYDGGAGDPPKPDIATGPYVRYKQKIKISIKEGYNTPSNIASQITEQLQRTEDPVEVVDPVGPSAVILQNSTTNKGITAANFITYNSSANTEFFDATLHNSMPAGDFGVNAPNLSGLSLAYLNNYDYVGFKRPEIVETGREAFAYNGEFTREAIRKVDAHNAVIDTSMPFTDENLLKVKAFFDSQTLYPELLDGGIDQYNRSNYKNFNLTSASLSGSFREEARFIHMDLGFESQGASKNDTAALGDDMYNVSYTESGVNVSDRSSAPVFVYFNKNSVNVTAAEAPVYTEEWQLAYGFGRRSPANTISFTTARIGGIPPDRIQNGNGTDTILSGTKVGYDYHFNAYGNAAIGFNNGYSPLQYFGHQEYESGKYIQQIYMGANNPLFNFDNVESRFKFQNLHTPEKTGNFYNAGDPQAPGDILAPPPSSQGNEDVYFINKQLRYDSWSPDMQPYSVINLSGTTASGNVTSFIKMNERLENARIYDSHSGIVIRDMGVTEEKWDESIWGLLGFRYSQFNPSGTVGEVKNINTRFNDNTTNVSGMTTNAEITSVTAEQYLNNAFSIQMFKPSMLPSNVNYYDNTHTLGDINVVSASHEVEPAISIQQNSTAIKAIDHPRKILRGYFLVNSDILDQADYYQTSNPLQTMAVVGKYNAATDFVNYDGGGPVFTVTRKKTITDIKTQILDPEGSLAQVGDNTGVIYRVDKKVNTDLKFGENLLAGMYGPPVGGK